VTRSGWWPAEKLANMQPCTAGQDLDVIYIRYSKKRLRSIACQNHWQHRYNVIQPIVDGQWGELNRLARASGALDERTG
jgi:hypothetical protein